MKHSAVAASATKRSSPVKEDHLADRLVAISANSGMASAILRWLSESCLHFVLVGCSFDFPAFEAPLGPLAPGTPKDGVIGVPLLDPSTAAVPRRAAIPAGTMRSRTADIKTVRPWCERLGRSPSTRLKAFDASSVSSVSSLREVVKTPPAERVAEEEAGTLAKMLFSSARDGRGRRGGAALTALSPLGFPIMPFMGSSPFWPVWSIRGLSTVIGRSNLCRSLSIPLGR